MNIGQALQAAEIQLRQAGITSSRLDAQLLLEHLTGRPRTSLLAHPEQSLTAELQQRFLYSVGQLASRRPLVHLTGRREFYGLDLEITADVLTPRVETEQMVDWAIGYAPQGSALIDIGTGSGALAIAIATSRPDLHITATDVSAAALRVARRNGRRHAPAIRFQTSDLFQNVTGLFHTVVTNLPYLTDDAELLPEVQREPAVALRGGPDGLSLYRRFLQQLPAHLAAGGYLFTECDPWQQAELIDLAAAAGLRPIEQGYFILGFRHGS